MAPTPNTKASKAKIVKRARAQTGGLAALSNDDIVTIAIAIRNAEKMKVNTTNASQDLGINKKAWSARWIRAKARLSQIETDAIAASGSKTSKPAKEDDDEDTDGNADAESPENSPI